MNNLTKAELEILDAQVLTYFYCGEHDYTGGNHDHGNAPKDTLDDMREYLSGDYTIGCIAAGFHPKIGDSDVRERLLINAYGKNYSEPAEDYDE